MVPRLKTFKSLLGAGLAALLLATLAPAAPAAAASLHQFQFRGNGGAFNLDQNACPPGMIHRRGSAECYDPQAEGMRRNDNAGRTYNNGQKPGSNAFGLQFDTGDY